MVDVVERDAPYCVGETTHYGTVIAIPPAITPFTEEVDQSVIVKLDPAGCPILTSRFSTLGWGR